MKLKIKAILGTLAATSAVAPAMSLLSSCSKTTQDDFYNKLHNTDKEYGIDEASYLQLKQQYKVACSKAVEKMTLPETAKRTRLANIDKMLTSYDNALVELKQKANAKGAVYTILSSAMIENAKREYGVKLNRKSNLTESSISQMFNGVKDSFVIYMQNNHFAKDRIDFILNNATARFSKLCLEAANEYSDTLSKIHYLQSRVLTCFEEVNNNISFLAASTKLS